MSKVTKHRVVMAYNHDIVVATKDTEQEAQDYVALFPGNSYEIVPVEVEMYVGREGEHHLPEPVRRSIAEWLVRTGGEKFNELEAYEGELTEGIFQQWYEREDTEYGNPLHMATQADRDYITDLVSRATVAVHLPGQASPTAHAARYGAVRYEKGARA